MNYLRYRPEIESPAADEAEAIQGIVHSMTHQAEKVADREHHAVRASHAKSSALVVGELTVQPNLPPELAQGLFALPRSYKVAIRFAQGPGERLADRVGTHRGMAIKVFGVDGEKLGSHRDDTQDFVLASGPTFPSGTAQGFLKDEKQLESGVSLPEGVKSFVSSAARNLNRVLHAVGTESPKADFFGHPFSHPLSEPYYSQAPIRFGDYVAKVAAFPAFPGLETLQSETIDVDSDPDAFRHATQAFIAAHETLFELRAQLWTDAEQQPIEDASVEWKESDSPFRTVATIRIPPQNAGSPERRRYFDEVMAFRPAHTLVAHQPLGSVMRARLEVYEALSDFRHLANGVAQEEPRTAEQIPA
ncbi:catalase family protein [Aureimonas leprariae]|uniref:Catalase family protein n=1 Tax=Plantimonas leprariae TaxID=2615207 RepID=A0A7V7PK77_9HYPH|nr:catalase family protein [Aureimonas leprariae]KAB0675805.1 catalase family protein [Aureimonas leprariae]